MGACSLISCKLQAAVSNPKLGLRHSNTKQPAFGWPVFQGGMKPQSEAIKSQGTNHSS